MLGAALQDRVSDGRSTADDCDASLDWHSFGTEPFSQRLYSKQGSVSQVPVHRDVDGLSHLLFRPRDAPFTAVVPYAGRVDSGWVGLVAANAILHFDKGGL